MSDSTDLWNCRIYPECLTQSRFISGIAQKPMDGFVCRPRLQLHQYYDGDGNDERMKSNGNGWFFSFFLFLISFNRNRFWVTGKWQRRTAANQKQVCSSPNSMNKHRLASISVKECRTEERIVIRNEKSTDYYHIYGAFDFFPVCFFGHRSFEKPQKAIPFVRRREHVLFLRGKSYVPSFS